MGPCLTKTFFFIFQLSEMTADLGEEHSAATLATERLEVEQAERMKLQKDNSELQVILCSWLEYDQINRKHYVQILDMSNVLNDTCISNYLDPYLFLRTFAYASKFKTCNDNTFCTSDSEKLITFHIAAEINPILIKKKII